MFWPLKYNATRIVNLFCFLLLCPAFLFSQKPEGTPFIRNYTPSEYNASTDNWAIAQDHRGIMYFGNASGVLEYDGNKWTLIPVTNNSLVRSIAIDSVGTIYIGAVGEFGFLAPDEKGVMLYHSLLDKLPSDERDFADVWKTYVTPEGVYFQTFSKLIRIAKNNIKIWKPETSFHFSFFINNQLYINEKERGLKRMVNDDLRFVEGGAVFAGLRIYAMLPYPGNKILIATREKGLMLMKEKPIAGDSAIHFFNTELNIHLIDDQVYAGVALKNTRYAFATLKNGVFITNQDGDILQVLNKKNGLQEDIVKSINIDSQQNLWIALGKGIAHAEISSPLSSLNDAQGLKGSILDIIKIKNTLYIATSLGVFTNIDDHFIPVLGISSQTWSLQKFIFKKDTLLLASSEAGVFKIENTNSTLLQEGFGYIIYQSKINPERIFIGRDDGLSSMRYENEHWINEGYLNGIDKEIRSIAEDNTGNLWIGTKLEGIVKIDFHYTQLFKDSDTISWSAAYKITNYDTTSGLPGMKDNIPYSFRNKIVFATDKGIYMFNAINHTFFSSPFLGNKLQQQQIYRFVPKDSSTVWLFTTTVSTKETSVAHLKNGNLYFRYTKPFGKIREREIHAIFPDENGITWLGGPDGLLRYDENVKKDFSQPFYAHIRKVKIGKDSLLFGGHFYSIKNDIHIPLAGQPDISKPGIDYAYNSFVFEYSATNYGDEQHNLFSVYLEGFDEEWSGWSNKSLKEYTNLKEGNYIFHVRAKDIYDTESTESCYSFKIFPPWYRTFWAYTAYIIAFICFVYLIIKFSIRRLVRAKTQLEKTIKERTAEVVKQKEEIEIQKQIVEHRNKDITDSINYAQRIQRALLASDQLLKNNLPDHFIFFQPKDIVSGDFYWAAKLANGQFAIVTADSTGHGVPGAIMSMLNISCLNEAVNGQKLSLPNEILNHTRSRIIHHLLNDGSAEGGKDGMDCSLISFDFANNELTYSAANNPVWIARGKEILEFLPDKMPIGKHDKDAISFTQHTVRIQKDDMVYTLTDGMPDQFGGPRGKKYMYKQLKELLLNISILPMAEQKELLNASFNNWKSDLEQVDDICIIGVRIKG
ncbi:MAG TPA: SpoIIE family protein phosphatase [Bacteroidia bacterium]|jgi:serine phosphatase RsbU (regulator of sigma subunit)